MLYSEALTEIADVAREAREVMAENKNLRIPRTAESYLYHARIAGIPGMPLPSSLWYYRDDSEPLPPALEGNVRQLRRDVDEARYLIERLQALIARRGY